MKVVLLEGVLMDNNEFICNGKSIYLSKEEIRKYARQNILVKKVIKNNLTSGKVQLPKKWVGEKVEIIN